MTISILLDMLGSEQDDGRLLTGAEAADLILEWMRGAPKGTLGPLGTDRFPPFPEEWVRQYEQLLMPMRDNPDPIGTRSQLALFYFAEIHAPLAAAGLHFWKERILKLNHGIWPAHLTDCDTLYRA